MNKGYYGYRFLIRQAQRTYRRLAEHLAKEGWSARDIMNLFMNQYELGGDELNTWIARATVRYL